MAHGAFFRLGSQPRDAATHCSVHGDRLLWDEVVGIFIANKKGGGLDFPSKMNRCPKCYPTVGHLIRFGLKQIVAGLEKAGGANVLDHFEVTMADGSKVNFKPSEL